MKNFKTYEEFLNKFTPMAGSGNRDYNTEGVAESVVNEAKDVKSDVIDKLSQFFNVSTSALIKFKFDGKDDIRALTKALNGTDYEGVDNIVRVAILSAKRDLGIEESIVIKAEETLTWGNLIERINYKLNEDLRNDLKSYIKKNEDDLNQLADDDNWDMIFNNLRGEFDIKEGTREDKEMIETFRFLF